MIPMTPTVSKDFFTFSTTIEAQPCKGKHLPSNHDCSCIKDYSKIHLQKTK